MIKKWWLMIMVMILMALGDGYGYHMVVDMINDN